MGQLSSLKACILGSSKVFLPSSNKSMEEYRPRHQPIRLLRQEVCRKWVPCQVVINRPCTDSFDFKLCHASLRAATAKNVVGATAAFDFVFLARSVRVIE